MTRFVAAQLARDHYFDITAARQWLGYRVRISMQEGLARLREAWGMRRILGLVALAGLVLTQRGKKAWALSVFLRIVSLFTVTLFGLEA